MRFLQSCGLFFFVVFKIYLFGSNDLIQTSIGFEYSDPGCYVEKVNVIHGHFTQVETDFTIVAPDSLVLHRFYMGNCWRIFPQAFLVVAGDKTVFAGERFGGILKYRDGKVDFCNGMVNTYGGEIGGKTDLHNHNLTFNGEIYEVKLGDGTHRIYKLANHNPSPLFWSFPQKTYLKTFELVSERLPSGNVLLFFYEEGRISLIEMKDACQKKLHAWIRFDYKFERDESVVTLNTSDERTVEYRFEGNELKKANGSHCVPVAYEYEEGHLIKKVLPEGRYLKVEYDAFNRVNQLKAPPTFIGEPEEIYRFEYGTQFTDVYNGMNVRTKYVYDASKQLTAIEQYDKKNKLYRKTGKYWRQNRLKSLSVADGIGNVYSFRSLEYDSNGNVEREILYGNLSGKVGVVLEVDDEGDLKNRDTVESHVKKFTYSQDDFNLLKEIGDVKGGAILFKYKPGTNQLVSKFIQSDLENVKRTFYAYNDDGVCVQIIEDDGCKNKENDLLAVTERHITTIEPRQTLPGVGLPQVVEEKACDLKTEKKITISKLVYSYFPQGELEFTQFYGNSTCPIYTINKTYTRLGHLQSETDPEGRQILYEYDDLGNLVLIIIPHQKRIIQKKYDLRNRLYEHNESADHLTLVERYQFDCLGRKISSTDRFRQITRYDFDEFDRIKKVAYPKIANERGDLIEPTLSYTYDIFGNILTITDPKGYVTKKSYTIRGDLSQIFYPDGTSESFKYDLEGSLHRSLSRENQVTVHEYDYQGRITYQETSKIVREGEIEFLRGHAYTYNAFRLLLEEEQKSEDLGLVSRFYHDPAGRIVKLVQYDGLGSATDPSARKTQFFYDPLGRVEKKKIWSNANNYFFECYVHNLYGQVVQKTIENGEGKVLLQRMFDYDTNGYCSEEYFIDGGQKVSVVKMNYDPFGELVSYIDDSDHETHFLIDYNGNFLRKILTNPTGNQTELEFDPFGRQISSATRDAKGTLIALQKIGYDLNGNKSVETNSVIFQGQSIREQISCWTYGPMSRLEERVDAAGSPEEMKIKFAYDSYGRLKTKTLPGLSTLLTYSYDAKNGLLSKVEHKTNQEEIIVSNNYVYDDSGNVIFAESENGIIVERDYNVFGELTKESISYPYYDDYLKISSAYQYDRLGRVTKIKLPDNSSIKYVYSDLFGSRVERISSKNVLLYQHKYDGYNQRGSVVREVTPVGPRVSIYDKGNRKTAQVTDYFSENIPESGYDLLNQLVAIEKKGNFPLENGLYSYDSFGQLITEQSSFNRTYVNDSLGNRRILNGTEVKYNHLNQLKESSLVKCVYDSLGNLRKKITPHLEMLFSHNALSQLVAVKKTDDIDISYLYDPLGRRVVKQVSVNKGRKKISQPQSYSFYFLNQELGVIDKDGDIQQLRIQGFGSDGLSENSIAIEIGEKTYIPFQDISGNIIALIDLSSKFVAESYSYSAFGERTVYNSNSEVISLSSVGNPWGYKNKRFEEETRLVHFGFRDYDPETTHWISPDPLGFIDGPNLYSFLHNSPLTHSDRLGFATEKSSKDVSFEKYFYGNIEPHCFCERHRTCKRGGDLRNNIFSHIPTVSYNSSFEKLWQEVNFLQRPSGVFDLQRPEDIDLGIGFINGVWNSLEDVRKNAEYISSLANGYNVHYVHNASHGYCVDLLECYMGINHIATEPVRELHNMWNNFFDSSSVNGKFLMIGHSQGVIHIRNALIAYDEGRRSRISVVGIAPGAYVYNRTCAGARHYRAESKWGDFIPRLDKAGAQREYGSIVNLKYDGYIPLKGHFFDNEIYKNDLVIEINRHLLR